MLLPLALLCVMTSHPEDLPSQDLSQIPHEVYGSTAFAMPYPIITAAFHGNLVALSSATEIAVFDRTDGNRLFEYKVRAAGILSFRQDGMQLAYTALNPHGHGKSVYGVIDLAAREVLFETTTADQVSARVLGFNERGGLLLSVIEDSGPVIRALDSNGVVENSTSLALQGVDVALPILSSDGTEILLSLDGKSITVLNADTLGTERLIQLKSPVKPEPVMAVAKASVWSPIVWAIPESSNMLVSWGRSGLQVVDPSGTVLSQLPFDTGIDRVRMHPAQPVIFVTTQAENEHDFVGDPRTTVFDLKRNKTVAQFGSMPDGFTGRDRELFQTGKLRLIFLDQTGKPSVDDGPVNSAGKLSFQPGTHQLNSIHDKSRYTWTKPRQQPIVDRETQDFLFSKDGREILTLSGTDVAITKTESLEVKTQFSLPKVTGSSAAHYHLKSWVGTDLTFTDSNRNGYVYNSEKQTITTFPSRQGTDRFRGQYNEGWTSIAVRPNSGEIVKVWESSFLYFGESADPIQVQMPDDWSGSADRQLVFTPSGSHLLVFLPTKFSRGLQSTSLGLLNCDTRQLKFRRVLTGFTVSDFAMIEDSKLLFLAGDARETEESPSVSLLKILSLHDGSLLREFQFPRQIRSLAATTDGSRLAVGAREPLIRVFKTTELLK